MAGPGAVSTNKGPAQTGGPGGQDCQGRGAWAADRTSGQGHWVRRSRGPNYSQSNGDAWLVPVTLPPRPRSHSLGRW